MLIRKSLFIVVILAIMVAGCGKENMPPTAQFTIEPVNGNDKTIFIFDASGSTDDKDDIEDLMVMWDWEGDNHFDTQYATRKTADHRYNEPGDYTVTAVVKDTRGLTDTLGIALTVTPSNLPPEVPENPFPADGESETAVNLNMKWECVDPDGDIILYSIYFGTNNPPPVVVSSHSYLGLDPDKLEYGTTYYWKVEARDVKGNITSGPVWSFTTIDLHFGSLQDDRDGQTYTTIQVGDQWWMAENLNFSTEAGSFCYEDKPDNCAIYGRLYTWDAAMQACPDGWHLPTKNELDNLVEHFEGSTAAGGFLKDYETNRWREPNEGASNKSGFGALPGGRKYATGMYAGIGYYAQFYSSTSFNSQEAYNLTLGYDYADAFVYNYKKTYAISVRCMKDY